MQALVPPSAILIDRVIRGALAEDLGDAGDITTSALIAPDARMSVNLTARQPGRLAGLDIALRTFTLLDPAIVIERRKRDGDAVTPGAVLAVISGTAHAILAGERTALNLISRLSGIATATRVLVDRIAGTRASIVCTRKTTPGLRALEKYAVRCGGGSNHRFGLYDAVLIKDNHVAAAGGIAPAIAAARASVGHMVKIEIEVDTLEQLSAVLENPVDVVLLDNMDIATVKEAVKMVGGRMLIEASGRVSPDSVRAIAETGVDLISSGAITHSAPILDIGLDATMTGLGKS